MDCNPEILVFTSAQSLPCFMKNVVFPKVNRDAESDAIDCVIMPRVLDELLFYQALKQVDFSEFFFLSFNIFHNLIFVFTLVSTFKSEI